MMRNEPKREVQRPDDSLNTSFSLRKPTEPTSQKAVDSTIPQAITPVSSTETLEKFQNGARLLVTSVSGPHIQISLAFDLKDLGVEGGAAHFVEHLMGYSLVERITRSPNSSPRDMGFNTAQSVMILSAGIPLDKPVSGSALGRKINTFFESVANPSFASSIVDYERRRIGHEDCIRRDSERLSDEVLKQTKGLVPSVVGTPRFIETVSIRELKSAHTKILDPARITGCLFLPDRMDEKVRSQTLQTVREWLKGRQRLHPTIDHNSAPSPVYTPSVFEKFDPISRGNKPNARNKIEAHEVVIAWHLDVDTLITAPLTKTVNLSRYAATLQRFLQDKIDGFTRDRRGPSDPIFYGVKFRCGVDPTGLVVNLSMKPLHTERDVTQRWLRDFMKVIAQETPQSLSAALRRSQSSLRMDPIDPALLATIELNRLQRYYPTDPEKLKASIIRCSPRGWSQTPIKISGTHVKALLNGISEDTAITVTPELFQRYGRWGTPQARGQRRK